MNGGTLKTSGFTMIELALVLIVLGILAAALLPMLQVVHEDSMREQDTNTMEVARKALMGYIRVHQGIPCIDASGAPATTACNAAETLNLLGVRVNDSRREDFVFDVNETLTTTEIATSGNSLCTALADIIDPPITMPLLPDPTLCANNYSGTGSDNCSAVHPMAFVLLGRGSDRCLNLENAHPSSANDAICPTSASANRTFENPVRIHSKTHDDGYYDDLLLAVTPYELAEEMGCPAGGGGAGFSYCLGGEKLVGVINGVNNAMGVELNGSCYTVDRGTSASLGCLTEATPIEVHGNTSCSSLQFSATVGTLDSNSDGRTDIVCNSSTCTSR